jgi:hypothetical protein
MGVLCGLGALALPARRQHLVAAAISLGIAGVCIYLPRLRF